MSSLIATINRDKVGADDRNKSICDGRTTACDVVGASGSWLADNAFAHVPGFASDITVILRESGDSARCDSSALSLLL